MTNMEFLMIEGEVVWLFDEASLELVVWVKSAVLEVVVEEG